MEVYSPVRVNGMASRLGMVPGLSLDLTTNDPDDGQPWDFSRKDKRDKVMDKILNKEALLVIGSPMCRMFSRLQQMNFSKMDPERKDAMMKEAKDHLAFSMAIYQLQMDNGMYFLHEHPWTATSWDEDFVKRLKDREGVKVVRGDMCQFGMYQHTSEGFQFVKKPTGFMTNASEIAGALD